jgi:hypothetical protein
VAQWMLTAELVSVWFDEYNTLLWYGDLPRVPVVVTDCSRHGAMGLMFPSTRHIELDLHLTEQEARGTLLHEMVHLWQSCHGHSLKHGPLFKKWVPVVLEHTGLSIL